MPGFDAVPRTRPNFSKISLWSSGAIPLPVSTTSIMAWPLTAAARTSTGSSFRRVLDGVVDQVGQHLPQPGGVAADDAEGRPGRSR